MKRKPIRPETSAAIGEMVEAAAKALGVDAGREPIEFTVCGSGRYAGSEAGAAEGGSSWADLLDFECLHAAEHPPAFPAIEGE